MFKLDLEKAEEPEIKLPRSIGSQKKQESSRKTSASLTTPKPLTLDHNKPWKILKEMGTPYLPPEKTVCRSRSRLLDMGRVRWYVKSNMETYIQFSSVQFSCSVVSDSLRPHESQHARPPCPSPTPRVHPNSCASSR